MKINFSNLRYRILPHFYPHIQASNRYIVSRGGAGSGKSTFAAQRMVFKMLEAPNRNGLAFRKTNNACKFSVFSELRKVLNEWELTPYVAVNLTNLSLTLPNDNTILCRGLDDPEKLKSINFEKGHITEVWLEEATELTGDDIDQVDLRLRGGNEKKTIHMTFNPVSKRSLIYSKFFKSTYYADKALYLQSTFENNHYLAEEYKERLIGFLETNPNFYSIYCKGEWGEVGNLVFENVSIEPITIDDFEVILYGADFGFNDPNVFVKWGLRDKTLYALNEVAVKGHTCAQFIEEIKPYMQGGTGYGDSAYPAYIQEMQDAGLDFHGAKKGKNSIVEGINALKEYKIVIDDSLTPFIAGEFLNYSWRKDATGEPMDVPQVGGDHAIDATRYAIQPLREGGGWSFAV